VNDAFRSKLGARLDAYREWARNHDLSSCRLVQYLGIECMGGLDVPLDEVESQIAGLVCEGLRVDWAEADGRLYLRVFEGTAPKPSWPKVFAEGHLTDLGAIVREAERQAEGHEAAAPACEAHGDKPV
jgi:hypothetical protein